ncbi:penicillin-binding transpeptidase domain-containing protein [Saccharibacillus sp. CPCC 101409]|uniref:penicillin-binding transpeptidase domain-containing protein n=1 Tax=Saccharibacillus sp. CPCC 101409 TaxID=3058041 RepID=UPI002673D76E|nr:penicillin-binding transpeptidase domain-containing protein [Saccharibacillus sp. CPCC 101409]MDO3409207.1 penicillin-binding transpeptidase domain-containing protein [Saccharibacillus sp. CPCC 101409]
MMTKRVKMRTLLIGGGITLFFLVLVGRIFFLQVVQGDFWHDKAVKQWSTSKVLRSERGAITDRNGKELAVDSPAYAVVVEPSIIDKRGTADDVVSILQQKLGVSESKLREMVTRKYQKDGDTYKKGDYSVWVEVRPQGWKIDGDLKAEIESSIAQVREAKGLDKSTDIGIVFDDQIKRFYPQHTLAANVLGYIDKEGNPKYGIESYWDEQLKGVDGKIDFLRDAKGVELPEGKSQVTLPKNGSDIQLTLDGTIQYYAEQAAKKAYEEYKPKSISVIAADPNTMDILAMVNMPTFDPNDYADYADDLANFTNLAVTGSYEPGSTFKIVTLSAAVQEGKFDPNASYQSGSIRIGRSTVHDINGGWGPTTYLDGVKHSSNVAFVKLGYEMVGTKKLTDYIKNFGFGEKTGIQLPGELKGTMSVNEKSPLINQAAITFGHNVAVTPIQQIAAISAVANGGHLLEPHIVKSVSNPQTGEVDIKNDVKKIRDVITPETAKAVSGYLEQVVSDQKIGTGRHAYIPGYRVAGKTGTAEKTGDKDASGNAYSKSRSVVSFVAYAPADDPKIAVFFMIDEPNDPKAGGGSAAAPYVKEIISQTLEYMGVPKQFSDTDIQAETENASTGDTLLKVTAPNLKTMNIEDAKSKLLEEGIAYEQVGAGAKVLEQYPAESSAMYAGQKIYLLTEDKETMKVPDLTGLALRDAVDILTLMDVSISTKGSGYVASQKLKTDAEGRRVVVLTLKSAKVTVTGVDDPESSDGSTGGEAVPDDTEDAITGSEESAGTEDIPAQPPADPAPESEAAPLN